MAGRPKLRLIVAIAVVLVVAAGIAIAIYGTRRTDRDLVKVEIRAKPVATIRFKGRSLGRTPLTIQVPRSTTAIDVEATFTKHGLDARGRARSDRYRQVKPLIPDAEQSLDFAIDGATRVPDDAP